MINSAIYSRRLESKSLRLCRQLPIAEVCQSYSRYSWRASMAKATGSRPLYYRHVVPFILLSFHSAWPAFILLAENQFTTIKASHILVQASSTNPAPLATGL